MGSVDTLSVILLTVESLDVNSVMNLFHWSCVGSMGAVLLTANLISTLPDATTDDGIGVATFRAVLRPSFLAMASCCALIAAVSASCSAVVGSILSFLIR